MITAQRLTDAQLDLGFCCSTASDPRAVTYWLDLDESARHTRGHYDCALMNFSCATQLTIFLPGDLSPHIIHQMLTELDPQIIDQLDQLETGETFHFWDLFTRRFDREPLIFDLIRNNI